MTTPILGSEETRASVAFLLSEQDPSLRASLRQALRREGYTGLQDAESLEALRHVFMGPPPDIAVLDVGVDPGLIPFIRDLRRGQIGINPFAAIILTTWDAHADAVRRLMGAGVDEILIKPLSVNAVLERVASQALRRKPYLATADYIGPDRRGGRVDPNAPGVDLIHPPNTLKARLDGHPIPEAQLRALVRETQTALEEQRFRRDVMRVQNLARSVQRALTPLGIDDRLRSEFDQMAELADQFQARVRIGPLAPTAGLFARLGTLSRGLRDDLPHVDKKAIRLLEPLAAAILAASDGAGAWIREVASLVDKSGAPRH